MYFQNENSQPTRFYRPHCDWFSTGRKNYLVSIRPCANISPMRFLLKYQSHSNQIWQWGFLRFCFPSGSAPSKAVGEQLSLKSGNYIQNSSRLNYRAECAEIDMWGFGEDLDIMLRSTWWIPHPPVSRARGVSLCWQLEQKHKNDSFRQVRTKWNMKSMCSHEIVLYIRIRPLPK